MNNGNDLQRAAPPRRRQGLPHAGASADLVAAADEEAGMTGTQEIGDWLEYGLSAELYRHKAMVRRWLREARGRKPVIDRWTAAP